MTIKRQEELKQRPPWNSQQKKKCTIGAAVLPVLESIHSRETLLLILMQLQITKMFGPNRGSLPQR